MKKTYILFTLLRQNALWPRLQRCALHCGQVATGINGIRGSAGFRKDSIRLWRIAPRLTAGCFTAILLTLAISGCTRVRRAEMIRAVYYCPFSETPLVVDGELNEPVWSKAKTISFVIPESLKETISKTEARMVYDKDYLYVAFKAYDKDIWGMFTERDSMTCQEDVLEVFIKTAPDKDPYFNFEMNVLGAVLDAYNVKRGAAGNYKRWSQWNCNGLKMASKVKGTINNWTDQDEYWILEVAIPFAELPTLNGKSPVKGDSWLFTLARYDYSIYLPEGRELSSSSPLSKVNFHLYEDWCQLIFN